MDTDEQVQEVAARVIKGWRQRKGMSQAKLAEQIGMHQTAIAKIESNERRLDFATAVRISKILGIPWEEFDVAAPSDLDKTINSLAKFLKTCEEWVDGYRKISTSRHEHLATLDDVIAVVGPARLPKTEEITQESFATTMEAATEASRIIFEKTPEWSTNELSDLLHHIDKIREFLLTLELERDRESA